MSPELPTLQAAFRFALEIAALVAWGMAGWALPGPGLRWAGAVGLPIAAAAAWAAFRVPGDASASGGAPVAIGGRVRLGLELAVMLGGAAAVAAAGRAWFGAVLASLVVLHYGTTLDRTRWLLEQ